MEIKAATEEKTEGGVAWVGNSMIYFNDLPHTFDLLDRGLHRKKKRTKIGCLLRGGATLPGLLRAEGLDYFDGCETSFSQLMQQRWHTLILNDYTQGPARAESYEKTAEALTKTYIPSLQLAGCRMVILYQTPAYRKMGTKDSLDLGDFADMTDALTKGYRGYAQILAASSVPVLVAPVGLAFAVVKRENPVLWRSLYCNDELHPSATGTYLAAVTILATLRGPDAHRALLNIDRDTSAFAGTPMNLRAKFEDEEWTRAPSKTTRLWLNEVAVRVVSMNTATPESSSLKAGL
jgi:hypothetical protein